jgi:predicted nuclease of predicted toxin-antitoxin system
MKFVIAMNLSPVWAEILNSVGYAAIHWSQIGSRNADDTVIFEWAHNNGYVVVTLDLDFGTMLAVTHSEGPSVIQIRREDVDPDRLQSDLLDLLLNYSLVLEEGALIILDDHKVRLRMLPF